MTNASADRTLKVFRVYIKADAKAIWQAIVDPAWNGRYGYLAVSEYDLAPGGAYRALASPDMLAMGAAEVMVDGHTIEADPPHKLVMAYRMLFSPDHEAEGFTTVTWEIVPEDDSICRVTLTHDVTGAPIHEATVLNDTPLLEGGGGWAWILSDLKSLLESGNSLFS